MALSRNLQRRLAYGSNATFITILVVVLVGVLYGIADRNRLRWDLSAEAANTLQPDTVKKLALLDAEGQAVVVTAFSHQEGRQDAFFKDRALRDLLSELDYQSSAVTTRFVDFDKERLTAEQLGVTEYGHLVVQRGDERVDLKSRELFRNSGKGADAKIEFLGESAFNRAIAQILSDRRRVIYSLRGHGELDPEEKGPSGLSSLEGLLDQENYDLKVLDFFHQEQGGVPAIPMDAAALIIPRATGPITPAEDDAILAYVAGGGALMMLLEPGGTTPSIFGRLGLSAPEGRVADAQVIFPWPDRPALVYGRSPIGEDLREQSLIGMFPSPLAIRLPEPAPAWLKSTDVLRTSRDGWVERGGDNGKNGLPAYQPDIDLAGPATVGWSLELQPGGESPVNAGKRIGRILVYGDADWMTNQLMSEGPANASLAVNSVRWLAWDDERASIVGQPSAVKRLALTEQDLQNILWMVLFVGPATAILLGAAVWSSRRGR